MKFNLHSLFVHFFCLESIFVTKSPFFYVTRNFFLNVDYLKVPPSPFHPAVEGWVLFVELWNEWMWHTASLVIGAPAWGRSTLQDAGPLETSSLEVSEQPYRGGGLVDLRWVSSGSFRSNDVVSRLYEIILQLAGEMKIVPQGSVGWCLSLPVC